MKGQHKEVSYNTGETLTQCLWCNKLYVCHQSCHQ